MSKPLFLILFSVLPLIGNGQQKNEIDINAGIAVNYNYNTYTYNKNHYSFPMTVTGGLGISYQRQLNSKTDLTTRLSVSRQTIKIRYQLNEPQLPINEIMNINEKYNVYNLSVGIRRYLKLRKLTPFVDISFAVGYSNYSVFGISGSTSAGNTTPLTDTLFYSNQFTEHHHFNKVTTEALAGLGIKFGKKKRSTAELMIRVPFTSLSPDPSIDEWNYTYKNSNYNYKIIVNCNYLNLTAMYGFAIFKK